MSLAMVAVNQTIHFQVYLTFHCHGNFSKLSLFADYCVSFANLVAVYLCPVALHVHIKSCRACTFAVHCRMYCM